ncbi:DEAD/DEAH box helicase [Candidatus Venteria ishoeyi]|uniref:DEAD/DEAH box helicase family protein n=1 Tax=Candidatus Venteria ishoeyi TaxID=1899563 RepID=UPI0025A52624|nr:DEAD/DEAH box helicase [Candidatus Venteria ishoeyi]MDM8548382.1 DEAD/DEAH box helicase [Candidatus Venteria ishoeyi]
MALLHYANLTENVSRPDILMSMTVFGLGDFHSYLERFKKYLESDAAVLRIAWQTSPPRYVAKWKANSGKPGEKGYWVSLKVKDSEKPDAITKMFLDGNQKIVYQANTIEAPSEKIDELKILQRDEKQLRLCLERKPKKEYLLLKEKGCWINLVEPDDRPDLPESVFQLFLDDNTDKVYQAEARDPEGQDKKHCWSFDRKNEISILDRDPLRNALLLGNKPDENKQWLLLRPNTYQIQKQLEAIRNLQNAPQLEHRPLLRLFEDAEHIGWSVPEKNTIQDWKLLTDSQRPGTDSQREFVETALNTPDFAFLEGPPGSGKTTTICELILQLIAQDKRVLLCASTHVAVDNVLERLMVDDNPYRDQVIPVRIGEKKNLSDLVRPYQYEKLLYTEKKRLTEFLLKQNPRNKAQQQLLGALNGEDNSTITKIILDSANLVCGTTLGILQHPDIKGKREVTPVFDVLIVDESSKTLFQEFLVPALWAKRWILVGDPRQLSPYVDDEAMAENIESTLPDPVSRDACLDVFQMMQSPKNGATLVASKEPKVLKAYQNQAEAYKGKVLFGNTQSDELTLNSASIIADTPENLLKRELSLPLDIANLRGDTSSLSTLNRRFIAWHKRCGLNNQEDKTWGGEIAWRLARQYENRQSQSKQVERLNTQVQDLLPANKKEQVQRGIERIRRVALPSVLESLQTGFERCEGQKKGTALTDGLPEYILKQRHVLLEYQHRMHPEIADYSREHIYHGQALNHPEDMAERRTWSYSRYAKRAIWLDVKPDRDDKGNSNRKEAMEIITEIKKFHEWVKSNPHPEGKIWTVAVLSFYRGQEKLLRGELRKLTKQNQGFQHFYLGNKQKKDINIDVCTVDRFQGHEADFVLLSFVKNYPTVFLGSPNRLNVAVTRARYQIVLVGNRQRLINDRYPELKALAESVPTTSTWEK